MAAKDRGIHVSAALSYGLRRETWIFGRTLLARSIIACAAFRTWMRRVTGWQI